MSEVVFISLDSYVIIVQGIKERSDHISGDDLHYDNKQLLITNNVFTKIDFFAGC